MAENSAILLPWAMIRALLARRKTMTRRIIDGVPMFSADYDQQWYPHVCPPGGACPSTWTWWEGPPHGPSLYHEARLPYAEGQRLWVKEAWRTEARHDRLKPKTLPSHALVSFEADYDQEPNDGCRGRYRHARFMPRAFSRLTLLVNDVRVERLQSIGAADTIAEGVECDTCAAMGTSACSRRGCFASIKAFQSLWNSLHGPDAWEQNPWVSAISFSVEHRNIDALPAPKEAPIMEKVDG